MSVSSEGDLSLVFSGPDIINGTGISVKEDGIIIEVQGISERYKRDDAPKDSPALHIYDALSVLGSVEPTVSDGEIKACGESQSGVFEALLDGTGHIVSLRFDEIDTVLHFKNHIDIK